MPIPDIIEVQIPGIRGERGLGITNAVLDGDNHLIVTLEDGTEIDCGEMPAGPAGVSITGAAVDESYHLILTLSTGATIDAGYVRGPQGDKGDKGDKGDTGDQGPAGADGSGTGDVVGPASSVNNRLAAFDGTDGKLLKDSSKSISDFATAAQGALADTAVQPADIGTAAAEDVGYFATAAQGGLADSAVQPGDLGTAAAEDVGYFATAAQGALADSAVQPGDVHAASAKASPVDDDEMSLWDSAASWVLKKWTIGNLKTLINGLIASYVATQDVEVLKGAIDCSGDPDYPAADAGHVYRVSVAGKIGGASGVAVEAGDRLECFVDSTASGDHATVGANWMVSQVNIDGAVVGPTSAVDSVPPLFDGTSGRLLKSAGSLSAWRTAVGLAIGSAVQAFADILDAIAALSSNGVIARTGSGTVEARTITGTSNEISVSNGNGVSGDPTISLPTVAKPYGKQAIPIPAGAMKARTTNGAASGTVEMTTNKNMFVTLDFDTSTQEFAQFIIPMPPSWDEGTVTFVPIWSHASTTTNFGVVWSLAGVAISNDDAGDVAFGTAQTSTDTGGTTNDIYFGPESSAITIAGSPAANDLVMFQIARVPSDGSDTMAVDARLHGIVLFITTDAGNDA